MAGWVRYTLMVGVIVLSGLVVWLVNPPVESRPHPNPPTDSPPLLESIALYPRPNPEYRRSGQTYMQMLDVPISRPYEGEWIPYEQVEPMILASAERLWQSGLLESLWVDVKDYPYVNGVVGRNVVFNFVERDGEAVAPDGPPRVPESYSMVPTGTARLYPR